MDSKTEIADSYNLKNRATFLKDLRQRSTSDFSGSMDSKSEITDSYNLKKRATLLVRPSAAVDS